MTTAAELFVVTLARASKRARRYLQGVESADRDDIIATAILWCWENRTTYNPTVALEDWFLGAIRNARAKWENGEARQATEMVEAIVVPDDTSMAAEARLTVERLAANMDATTLRIAALKAEGHEVREISALTRIPARTVKRRLRALKKLRDHVPDAQEWRKVLRASPVAERQDDYEGQPKESRIDKEIERLEFVPPQGRECPPCWRCKWFEGYLPGAHRPVQMPIVEPAVRAAVLATETRKVEIAKRVRSGALLARDYPWV